jgi:glycine/D-amino acid oxidase-like deaminating enzyme
MHLNESPWLFELRRKRPVSFLVDDMHTNVAIVGGGIAGVVTAYCILKHTTHTVVLLEAHKIAHGATGHNAGQVASYFETPFEDIVKEFGLKMAYEGQAAVESAWGLLEQIYEEAKLETPLLQFSGYAGCSSYEEVLSHLKDIAYHRQYGDSKESILIAAETDVVQQIPHEYKDCYTLVPQRDILALLETTNTKYIAALVKRKGCLNSALFTEELVGYLLSTYADRFTLAEHTPVDDLILKEHTAVLAVHSQKKFVVADHVILCTNGFEYINIINTTNEIDIDTKFHHLVRGAVGYMAGYLEERDHPPTAISYLPDTVSSNDARDAEPYYYLTRRPFEYETNEQHNLICIGGPEIYLDDTTAYQKDTHSFKVDAEHDMKNFLKSNYRYAPKKDISFTFLWHGLMGYTPNGIRCVGFEPCNPVLLYNLGCNGVGILPSIYGAKRIAQLLAGETLVPSIFDPRTQE